MRAASTPLEGAALPAAAEEWGFEDGSELAPGRYALKLLGGGERYESYLAWDERLYSLVVVKVLRPHLVEDADALRGLAEEARLLDRLRHPVLVRGFDSDLEGPRPHVVLEHLEGPRLSTLIRKYGPLEPEQLLPLGLQLCSALHYLGCEGMVHLDVKPSNIIMGAPARLIDLSIARSKERLAGTRGHLGTDAYMAPEQCDPVARGPITEAADVWGMGATLYHAAAGHRPFAEPEAGEPRFPQLHDPPAPMPAHVAAELEQLLLACLDPDPSARPAPKDVAESLEPLLEKLPKRAGLGRFRVRPR